MLIKNIKNFVWFPKQYLLGFFLLEKQLANILDRGFLFLRNTFLLYSLSPYPQTERWTESQIHSLHVGWRNFFPVVLLCQFFVLAGNRFWFYILTYVTWQIILQTNIFLIVGEVLAMFFGGFLRWSNYNRKNKKLQSSDRRLKWI